MDVTSLVLGTRGSELALWQAHFVKSKLEARGHRVEVQPITTRGDQVLDVPISQLGDESVFTKEIDRAMLAGEVDVAVHSLKDLPSRLPDGITLAAVGEREVPFDAFVAHPSYTDGFENLPEGATIATSSLRRKAQLKAWRPDLTVVPVRGNVDTRLSKLDASDWHGTILAVAGLIRMGLSHRITEHVPSDIMVPAVGQGALGIACREEDEALVDLLHGVLHHWATGVMVAAERGFMRQINGGCQVPTGAWARFEEDDQLRIDGSVAALDGSELYRGDMTCAPDEAHETGRALATHLLQMGGREVLSEIRQAL